MRLTPPRVFSLTARVEPRFLRDCAEKRLIVANCMAIEGRLAAAQRLREVETAD